jgi:glycerol-3-phosphate dehydrogenase
VAALTVPSPGSRSRHVYALPRPGGLVHPRLTDQPVPDDDPVPPDAEVQQLLDTVNTALAEPLTRADVVGSWVVSQDPR